MLVVVQALTAVSKDIYHVPLRKGGKTELWVNNHNATTMEPPKSAKIISRLLCSIRTIVEE